MSSSPKKILLLPHYFQKVAILFFILSVFGIFILKHYFYIGADTRELLGHGILISFFIFMLTSRKVEDEMSMELRLKAYALAFQICIMTAITDPYLNLLVNGEFALDIGAWGLLMIGIVNYIAGYVIFYLSEEG